MSRWFFYFALVILVTGHGLQSNELDAKQKYYQVVSQVKDLLRNNAELRQAVKPLLKKVGGVTAEDILIHQWAKDTICNHTEVCDGIGICATVCERGTVQIDPWLEFALKTQRTLNLDQPINYIQLPGAHNAAITKVDSYGLEEDFFTEIFQIVEPSTIVYIANQQLSLFDELRLGIRHIELDIHWFLGSIRICHAGGIHLQLLDEMIQEIDKILGITIDWDSETIGCGFPNYKTLNQSFDEILSWVSLPENENEFLMFMFDDQEDLLDWDKVQSIIQGLNTHFGDKLFTPADKAKYFPNSWPSVNDLINLKKTLLFTSRTDYGAAMSSTLFPRDSLWTEFDPSDLQPYPQCTLQNSFHINQGAMCRVLADSLVYGPFWNGTGASLFVPATLQPHLACNSNFLCMDQVSPTLMYGLVWSWDKNEPKEGECGALMSNTRWRGFDCKTEGFVFACQDTTSPYTWKVSSGTGAFASGSQICAGEFGANFVFGLPVNGLMNTNIFSQWQTSTAGIWINVTS